ncbi:hypothetical protein WJT86_10115 [Microvirga sp. W0021]|uniref:Uncharacterized protein n=1 Tax=Hohaiivirga grylli TaxID=3133970 RepID=A0ABV0BKW2_9HYPH
MTEKRLPPLLPPQTRIVDDQGRMTKEFYDYLLRLNAKLEQSDAGLKQRKEVSENG